MKKILLLFMLTLFYASTFSQVTVTLGTYEGSGSTNVLLSTSTTSNRYSRTISLYPASEIIAEGGIPGLITSLAWDKSGAGEYTSNDAYIKVYLKHVTNTQWTSIPDWNTEVATAEEVFTSSTYSIPIGTGWKEVSFTTPFHWNGTDNIAVFVEWDRSSTPTGAINWGYETHATANATRVGSTSLNALVFLINDRRPLLQLTMLGSGCWKPANLTMDNLFSTSAEFSWTASPDETDGYNWAVMADGEHPDNDIPIEDGSTATGILTATATQLTHNTSYSLFVQTNCGSDLSFWEGSLDFTTPIIPPDNDECDDAIMLSVGIDFNDQAVVGHNLGGTVNPNDPLPTCDAFNFATNSKDVWYKVDVPASGVINVETRSNNDPGMSNTGMEIYSGTCINLTLIECDADSGIDNFSLIELTGQTPGETLLIRVWGYNSHQGEFLISAYEGAFPCENPNNLALVNVGSTYAEFSWSASPTETAGYVWAVMMEGELPDVDTPIEAGVVSSGETTATASNLLAENNYDFYVQTDCGADGLSYWEGPLSFTTATVNIHQNNLENLVFYPNPMGENLNIISQNEVFEIAIFNLTGQKILTHKMHNNIGAIDVSYLASGTYLMQVISESGETSFLKLIKK